MAEPFTSQQQTAAIRAARQDGMDTSPQVSGLRSAPAGLHSALAYLRGEGLHEVTTLTMAAHHRGKPQVLCDTDVMFALCLLAAEALEARQAGTATLPEAS